MQFISELITRKKKLYIVFLKGDARQKKHDSDDPNGKCNNELTWLTTEMGNEDLLVDKDHKQHGNLEVSMHNNNDHRHHHHHHYNIQHSFIIYTKIHILVYYS